MGTIQRGPSGHHTAKIRIKGFPPLSRTFPTRPEAETWLDEQETLIRKRIHEVKNETERHRIATECAPQYRTLGDLMRRYLAVVTPQKRSADQEALRMNGLLKHSLADCPISSLSPQRVAEWRDLRLQSVSSSTVKRDMTLLAHVLKIACDEWGVFWRKADQLLTFPEVHGLCIGYATTAKAGSGMGPKLRAHLLKTVHQIVQAGVKDPALFEIVGAFEDNVGPDRISDMVAKIISADLVAFTQRVCSDLGIPMKPLFLVKGQPPDDMPENPATGDAIILVPKDVLRDLPIAESYGDIAYVAQYNEALRAELNAIIGKAWSRATVAEKKEALRNSFPKYPGVLLKVLQEYKAASRSLYDFKDDPSGETIWYRSAKQFSKEYPLHLSLESPADTERVFEVVKSICEHFRCLVEDNQLCKLLYDKGGKPKHESASQLLFYGIAAAYCTANGIELSPESNGGRGPVDFKMSSGFDGRVLVEVKLTSNSQLFHGFDKQLPIYQKAERATRGIYLVIDNGGASDDRMAAFRQHVLDTGPDAPMVMIVDGVVRPSASKADY